MKKTAQQPDYRQKAPDEIDYRYLTSDNSSGLYIRNFNSQSGNLFGLRAPFMLILETCIEKEQLYTFYQMSIGEHTLHTLSPEEYQLFVRRPQHQHSYIEIMFVLSGEVTNHVESQVFTYKAGDCVVMNRNIRHIEDMTGTFRVMFVAFQEEFINELISEEQTAYWARSAHYRSYVNSPIIQMLLGTQSARDRFKKIYFDCLAVTPEKAVETAEAIFDTILMELIDEKPGSYYMIKACFQKFLFFLCDPAVFHSTSISSTLTSQSYLVTKARQILEAQHGRISRSELARQLHYNEEYLNRVIRQITGKTFSQYRENVQLHEASRLLVTTSLSVSAITEQLGITNRTFFYRIFEDEFGMKPLEYRRRFKAETSGESGAE